MRSSPAPETREGLVLTRAWRDTPRGVVVELWVATSEGPVRVELTRERAVMFVHRGTEAEAIARREVELTDLRGRPVDALYFDTRRQALDCRDRLRAEGVSVYESDVRPHERFLMERFVTGSCRLHGPILRRHGHAEMRDPKVSRGEATPSLRRLSLDIETDGMSGPVISVALVDDEVSTVLMVGEGSPPDGVTFVADERALLEACFGTVRARDPDLIVGWNVVGFDLTHLQARCEKHRLRFDIARGRGRAAILAPQSASQLPIPRIPGRAVLDGIRGLEAATYSFESFALEDVAQALLGEGKAIDHGTDKVGEIKRMHREDPAALARYNRRDAELVLEILDATDLVDFMIARQKMTGLPLSRVGGSVAAFDHLYLPRLHRHGHVAGDTADVPRGNLTAPGGVVLASRPGLYRNVVVFDFKSLYPSIIRTFRVDPLGLAFPEASPIEGFDGASFARERHILPGLIEDLWKQRDNAKLAHDKPRSTAIKILMNSFYGVLGTPGCRFFDPRLASSITRRGHQIIRETRDRLIADGHPVIYGDTDSLFVWLGDDRSREDCLETARNLAETLNAWWTERIEAEHGVVSALELEFESHFTRFFMPTLRGSAEGSAKRYAGLVLGPDGPELVIKGLEAVRTDWTPLARRFQRELLWRIFRDEPVEAWIRDLRRSLFAGELDAELIYRKRLRRRVEDYQRSLPPHVKAAKQLGRDVKEIRYVITIDGPAPVELAHGSIDHHHYLDRQLAPAAEGILASLGLSFEAIAGNQLALF